MKRSTWLAAGTFLLLGVMMSAAGCVVRGGPGYETYHEGYWDREHNRYWHENGWHDCGGGDPHCR
jgi:hypothetical protein